MPLAQLVWTWALLWLLASAVLRHVRRHHHRPAAVLHGRLLATLAVCALLPWTLLADGMAMPLLPADMLDSALERQAVLLALALGAALGGAAVALENAQLRRASRAQRPAPDELGCEVLARDVGGRRPLVRLQPGDGVLPAPCTFGWRRPAIVLPDHCDGWTHADLRIVLLHEMAHVDRNDWLWERVARALRWSLWWLPPAGALYRELRKQAEHAADDWVMARGVGRTDYAECLLRFAGRPGRAPGVALALLESSALAGRAAAILDGSRVRQASRASHIPFLVALLLAAAVIAGGRLAPLPGAAQAPEQWRVWRLAPSVQAPATVLESVAADDLELAPLLPAALPELPPPARALVPGSAEVNIDIEVQWPASMARPLLVSPLIAEYPAAALRRGTSGAVTARFDVASSGRPVNITIVASEPPGVFDATVLAALERARFHRPQDPAPRAEGIELQVKFVPHTRDRPR